ncbi:hypothetical protein [Sphingomonas sp. BK235]|uniref:hypothetical protein n=1 Tax=Sphingomonas sp. BK235 TaxID=2512131 RepID=UPI0010463A05|nr:hypothetical protein [Sphingomonas sp. BK235]TCP30683.1 hypothetical protein EV292_11240 [Sphingomonas sp. BK235]
MTDTPSATAVVVAPPARASWKDLVPAIALIITVVGLLLGGGKILGRVESNSQRIEKLEQRADTRDVEQSDMKADLAAINAKLDLLIRRTSERP